MGQRAIPSWISRHSYLSAAQTVKNKKLDHRVKAVHTLKAAPQRSVTRTTAAVEEAITTRIRQRREDEPSPQPETTPPPVSPAMPALLPTNEPEPLTNLLQDQGERRSPATPPRKRPVRPMHRFAPRQLSLLQSEAVPRSPAPSSQACPELWQPPCQLSLL